MITFFLYLLKSGICLFLFYGCFKALFSNDTFFRLNRWILLAGVVVCFLLPVTPFETKETTAIHQPIVQLERLFEEETVLTLEETAPIQTIAVAPTELSVNIPWNKLFVLLYLSGCAFCLGGAILSFYKMFRVIRSGKKCKLGNHTLILTDRFTAPFSWGRYIILSEEDYRDHPDEILVHEKMHLHYRHSLDLIFMEIVLLLQWFNPAAWLLKRELRDIHEYQADRGVLNKGIDATKYQLLLVKKAVGSSLYTLANSFNHSKIKKRITMMLKQKSNSWARLKLLLLVPVGFTAVCVFARPEVKDMNSPTNSSSVPVYKDMNSAGQMKGEPVNSASKPEYTTQQKKKVWEVLYVAPSDEKNTGTMVCSNLNYIIEALRRKFKILPVIQIQPVENGVPQEYLEGLKKDVEARGLKGKIESYSDGKRTIKYFFKRDNDQWFTEPVILMVYNKDIDKYPIKGANPKVRFTEPVITKDTVGIVKTDKN